MPNQSVNHFVDTKLKADIAETAVTAKLLRRGLAVLRPVGDRLPSKTNRRRMLRTTYCSEDFDFAVLYIDELDITYIMPVDVFITYKSGISLVEAATRQRKPRAYPYREAWHLLSNS